MDDSGETWFTYCVCECVRVCASGCVCVCVCVCVWVCVFASHLLRTHWRAQLPRSQCRISWWSERKIRIKDTDYFFHIDSDAGLFATGMLVKFLRPLGMSMNKFSLIILFLTFFFFSFLPTILLLCSALAINIIKNTTVKVCQKPYFSLWYCNNLTFTPVSKNICLIILRLPPLCDGWLKDRNPNTPTKSTYCMI